MTEKKRDIISIDAGNGLKDHLKKSAEKKKLTLTKYCKEVLKKHSGFKPKELI